VVCRDAINTGSSSSKRARLEAREAECEDEKAKQVKDNDQERSIDESSEDHLETIN
jgi:hypothetical protein